MFPVRSLIIKMKKLQKYKSKIAMFHMILCNVLCISISLYLLCQSITIFITRNTIEQSSAVFIDEPDQNQENRDPAQDHHCVAEPEQSEVTRLK